MIKDFKERTYKILEQSKVSLLLECSATGDRVRIPAQNLTNVGFVKI